MSQPPPPPSNGLANRVLLVVIAVLLGVLTGFIAGVIAMALDAPIFDATKWAGATFIAVTMLLLKIRELLQ